MVAQNKNKKNFFCTNRKDEKEIDKLLLGKLEFQVSMRLSPIQAKIYNALTNAAQTSITATGLLALHSPITYLLWDPAILKRVVAEREGIEIPLSDSSGNNNFWITLIEIRFKQRRRRRTPEAKKGHQVSKAGTTCGRVFWMRYQTCILILKKKNSYILI